MGKKTGKIRIRGLLDRSTFEAKIGSKGRIIE